MSKKGRCIEHRILLTEGRSGTVQPYVESNKLKEYLSIYILFGVAEQHQIYLYMKLRIMGFDLNQSLTLEHELLVFCSGNFLLCL